MTEVPPQSFWDPRKTGREALMCVIETTPKIETRRLALRALEPRDAARIAELASDEAVARMTARLPHPYAEADARDFLSAIDAQEPRDGATFALELEDAGLIGVIGLSRDADGGPPEVGYWIGRPWWGRGLAVEGLQGLLGWARAARRLRAAQAIVFEDNPASARVLEKAGFLPTGVRRDAFSLARGALASARGFVWLA